MTKMCYVITLFKRYFMYLTHNESAIRQCFTRLYPVAVSVSKQNVLNCWKRTLVVISSPD